MGTAASSPPRRRRAAAPSPPRVVAVVPARDEEPTIALTVKALYHLEAVAEVVVVDDGSGDGTAAVANAAGARVFVAPGCVGKGGALEGALDRIAPADFVMFVDGDVGETAAEAALILAPVLAGGADLAVARFPDLGGGGFGIVKRLSRALVRRVGGLDVLEPMSGQRAMTAAALSACRPLAPGFGVDVAMTIDAARLGLRVQEVPVSMRHRATGRTPAGFAHRARQGVDILRATVPRALGLR